MRLVADAWSAGVRPQSLFYDPDALRDGSPGAALLYEMMQAGVEAWACTPAVSVERNGDAGGLAAVVPLPELPLPVAPTLVLVLDGVHTRPGQCRHLLRSAEAVGTGYGALWPRHGGCL